MSLPGQIARRLREEGLRPCTVWDRRLSLYESPTEPPVILADRLDDIDLEEVLVIGALTDERLADIREYFLNSGAPARPGWYVFHPRADRFRVVRWTDSGATPHEPDGADPEREHYTWEILDKDWELADTANHTQILDRIRTAWPASLGQLVAPTGDSQTSFHWTQQKRSDNALKFDPKFDLKFWGAFYSANNKEGQWERKIVESRSVAEDLGPEPTCLGRIWLLPTWEPDDPIFYGGALTMSFDLIAFVINQCQTVDLFLERLLPYGNHPFSPGIRFVQAFADPNGPRAVAQLVELGLSQGRDMPKFKMEPANLVLQYHVRHIALDSTEAMRKDDAHRLQQKPAVVLHRQRAVIRGRHTAVSLLESVSSISLSILNTRDAPYTIVVLVDDIKDLLLFPEEFGIGLNFRSAGESVFPAPSAPDGDGMDKLHSGGRCIGLIQFIRMVLKVFERWETTWLRTLRGIGQTADFRLNYTLFDDKLDALMFDDSFTLSRTYFSALQTLRQASNMVDDAVRNWSDLRRQWDAIVSGGIFSDDDLAAATHNWDMATATIEAKARRVQDSISRKTEEIKSLRDGLFNASSLREAQKSIALNRAIYVFTVVTVLYTPVGFLATFWALPFFANSGGSGDNNQPTTIPSSFTTTFIVIPVLTYAVCIAVAWFMGTNDAEKQMMRRRAREFVVGQGAKWSAWAKGLYAYVLRRRSPSRASSYTPSTVTSQGSAPRASLQMPPSVASQGAAPRTSTQMPSSVTSQGPASRTSLQMPPPVTSQDPTQQASAAAAV